MKKSNDDINYGDKDIIDSPEAEAFVKNGISKAFDESGIKSPKYWRGYYSGREEAYNTFSKYLKSSQKEWKASENRFRIMMLITWFLLGLYMFGFALNVLTNFLK